MKRILLVILASIALVGCEKFLDTQSYTSSNTTNFPSNEEEAIKLVTGVYASLNDGIEDIRSTYIFLAELASDDAFGGGGPDDPDWQALDHLLYVDPEQFKPFWNSCYAGIGRANMALSTLDKINDDKVRTQLMGECYILRANYYFWLAQMFGKLPLITEVPQNVEEAAQYPSQSSDDAVYAFIPGNLKEAIETMPTDPQWIPVTLPYGMQRPFSPEFIFSTQVSMVSRAFLARMLPPAKQLPTSTRIM